MSRKSASHFLDCRLEGIGIVTRDLAVSDQDDRHPAAAQFSMGFFGIRRLLDIEVDKIDMIFLEIVTRLGAIAAPGRAI